MTSISIPPNDSGQQNLKIDNSTPATAPAVSPVPATRGVPETPRTTAPAVEQHAVERRKGERRRHDRRQQQDKVLLDTRTNHDRRTHSGQRESDGDAEKVTTPRGIDTTI